MRRMSDLDRWVGSGFGLVSWLERGEERTGKKAVQLDEQLEIDVIALWGFAVGAAHMVYIQIDT